MCVNFKMYNFLFADEIHLASFTALQSSFQRFGQYIGGHVDAFSHFAVNDINNKMFNLSTGKFFYREHRGCGFNPHQRHCVVSLSKTH